MVSTDFPEASTFTTPVEYQWYGCYIFPPPDHPLRKKQHSNHQKHCNSCKTHSSCNYCRPSPVRPEVKKQQPGCWSKRGKKVSLQEFYKETPDFFRPPEVKLFMQWVVFAFSYFFIDFFWQFPLDMATVGMKQLSHMLPVVTMRLPILRWPTTSQRCCQALGAWLQYTHLNSLGIHTFSIGALLRWKGKNSKFLLFIPLLLLLISLDITLSMAQPSGPRPVGRYIPRRKKKRLRQRSKSSRRSFAKSKCLHVFLDIPLTVFFRKFRKTEGFSRGPIKEE